MSLQRRILKGIDDQRPVLSHSDKRGPLNELIDQYMLHAIHNDALPNITNLTTGLELKQALELLDAELELELIKNYADAQRAVLFPHLKLATSIPEAPEKAETRKLKHFLIKTAFITLQLFIGGVLFAAYRAGGLPDSKVIGPIMSTVSDVAKLIFSTK